MKDELHHISAEVSLRGLSPTVSNVRLADCDKARKLCLFQEWDLWHGMREGGRAHCVLQMSTLLVGCNALVYAQIQVTSFTILYSVRIASTHR